jgi:hypothetical protein
MLAEAWLAEDWAAKDMAMILAERAIVRKITVSRMTQAYGFQMSPASY